MRFRIFIAAILACIGIAIADSTTSRVGLQVPDIGGTGWGTKLNSNWNVIDSSFAVISGSQTWIGENLFTANKASGPYPIYVKNIWTSLGTSVLENPGSVAIGVGALNLMRDPGYIGRPNVAIGASAMSTWTDGGNTSSSGGNVGVGYGVCMSSNSENTCIGDFAGAYNTDGSNNVYIGALAGAGAGSPVPTHGSDLIYIGQYTGNDKSTSSYITNAVAIGAGASVNQSNSLSLGCMDSTLNAAHHTCLGSETAFNVGIGTDTPKERLHIVGNLRVDNGTITVTTQGFVGNAAASLILFQPNFAGSYSQAIKFSQALTSPSYIRNDFFASLDVPSGLNIYSSPIVFSYPRGDMFWFNADGRFDIGAADVKSARSQFSVRGSTNSAYQITVSTSSTDGIYDFYVSTQNVVGVSTLQLGSRTVAQLKATTPSAAGQIYYCSDCTTDAIVISTGTTLFGFGRSSARTTTPQ